MTPFHLAVPGKRCGLTLIPAFSVLPPFCPLHGHFPRRGNLPLRKFRLRFRTPCRICRSRACFAAARQRRGCGDLGRASSATGSAKPQFPLRGRQEHAGEARAAAQSPPRPEGGGRAKRGRGDPGANEENVSPSHPRSARATAPFRQGGHRRAGARPAHASETRVFSNRSSQTAALKPQLSKLKTALSCASRTSR